MSPHFNNQLVAGTKKYKTLSILFWPHLYCQNANSSELVLRLINQMTMSEQCCSSYQPIGASSTELSQLAKSTICTYRVDKTIMIIH